MVHATVKSISKTRPNASNITFTCQCIRTAAEAEGSGLLFCEVLHSQESALELLDIQTENQGRSCLVTMVKYSLIYPKTVCMCVRGSGPKLA